MPKLTLAALLCNILSNTTLTINDTIVALATQITVFNISSLGDSAISVNILPGDADDTKPTFKIDAVEIPAIPPKIVPIISIGSFII